MPFNLSRTSLIILTAALVITISCLIFSIHRMIGISHEHSAVSRLETEIATYRARITKESRTMQTIKTMDRDYLKSAYFDRNSQFVEAYVRSVLESYHIDAALYQSTMNEKDFTEVDVSFTIDIQTLFRLIKTFETGPKMIILKRLSVKASTPPRVKVTMKLGGYYGGSR
jgi:hypothetical protein